MSKFKFQQKAQEILEALYVDPDTDKLDFNYKGKDGLKITLGKGKGFEFEPFVSKSKDFGGSEVISLFSTSHVKGMDREDIVTLEHTDRDKGIVEYEHLEYRDALRITESGEFLERMKKLAFGEPTYLRFKFC